MRRLIISLVAVLAATLGLGMTACQAVGTGYVHVEGSQLLGPDGNPMQLKGVALGSHLLMEPWLMGSTAYGAETKSLNKLATVVGQPAAMKFRTDYADAFVTQATIDAIAGAGFNVIRLPFNARYQDMAYLDRVVNWAAQAGIYVILDMHAAPCSQNPYFTSDSVDGTAALWVGENASGMNACKQATLDYWRDVAAHFATNTTVAGYDELNEPDGWAMSNAELFQMYQWITATIRSVDANHLVMFEGRNYTKDVATFTGPIDSNAMLTMHQYASSTLTPDSNIQTEIAAADRLGGIPVWVGEFGLDRASVVDAQITRFERYPRIVGWSYWAWKFAARSDNQDAVREYTAPANWVPVIDWAGGKTGVPAPTAAQATQAMADLLGAVGNTTVRADLLAALQAHL